MTVRSPHEWTWERFRRRLREAIETIEKVSLTGCGGVLTLGSLELGTQRAPEGEA
jgi:hypothetical protein